MRTKHRRRKAAQALANIRLTLGIPDWVTDEDISMAIVRFGQTVAQVGIPAQEAMERMNAACRMLNNRGSA